MQGQRIESLWGLMVASEVAIHGKTIWYISLDLYPTHGLPLMINMTF